MPETHFNLACAYQSQGKAAESIEEYSLCIKGSPNFANAYYHRGLAYETIKKPAESKRDFESYLKFAKNGKYSRDARSKIEEIDLTTTGELEHNDPTKYYEQAQKIVEAYGDMPKAIKLFSKSLKLNPKSAKTYFGRGCAFGEMGYFSLAVKDYTKTIELKPEFEPAYFNRGFCNYSMSRFQSVIDDLTRAIHMNPKNGAAYGIRS
ncbi:MAG: hypothetical protein K8F91_18855, partial [Candidatus Obscuribacterales bacterium]|nr:hypothetical protein [Candidatus Obscuribacterales bacterium]